MDTTTLIVAILGLLGSFITWYLNERQKIIYEEYKRKEERYNELIKSLKGFYANSPSNELKNEFLHQLKLCWMYCPDNII